MSVHRADPGDRRHLRKGHRRVEANGQGDNVYTSWTHSFLACMIVLLLYVSLYN